MLKACGRGARKMPKPAAPVWRFWTESERAQTFLLTSVGSAWFVLKILAVAFALESLMIASIPAERVAGALAAAGPYAIPLAVGLGVPAYLNGLAAIPLVNGLIGLGMSPAAGLAFMTAGGITCIPAAAAMYGLLRPRTFALYLAWSVATAPVSGWSYALYLAA